MKTSHIHIIRINLGAKMYCWNSAFVHNGMYYIADLSTFTNDISIKE